MQPLKINSTHVYVFEYMQDVSDISLWHHYNFNVSVFFCFAS